MIITFTMFLIGILLGFIGAGGSGFIIAILTVVFGVPIHTALGTSLAAMVFTTLSGAYSHYRQGNIDVKAGLTAGIFGAVFSYFGSRIAVGIPVDSLHWLTAGMLFLSAVMLMTRLFLVNRLKGTNKSETKSAISFLIRAAFVGIVTGVLSGTFGIGSAPFIQLGLLIVLGLSLQKSVGTTMLVILPIAMAGGIGYYFEGYFNVLLLVQVLAGTMIGSYIGAKFTNHVPVPILKIAMVLTPIMAGATLLIL
ncbi:sulfite exporter TauE/SafE family protein [Cytobacillus firmus]|uniref:sulfite exporter TauE/SafE family protein n=1 Tax=Cytobacillus firmus TaxID=1399 RepID=UPI002163ACBA|nr:sulfite exporter TauE/SafE family protein [Cytobacillus firmus]MCS0670074.1 sulfite exporter TauE/SafE family protein [Cytobacillus firmus]